MRCAGKEVYGKFMDIYRKQTLDLPVPRSCKSMFHFAKELDCESLQTLALNHLKEQLSKETILTELFSEFTSQCVYICAAFY
ncbi:hypothetical protein BKA93DRAFT_827274 [Sparassis latifolia]